MVRGFRTFRGNSNITFKRGCKKHKVGMKVDNDSQVTNATSKGDGRVRGKAG